MFPIHVIGELARPISLGIRLYGNIFGEETILAVLAGMTIVFVPYFVAIPTQFPMMLFAIFTSFVQALVFSTLTAIYISIAVSNHAEH
jgi:F-type H+-transporting ATPase subunit a